MIALSEIGLDSGGKPASDATEVYRAVNLSGSKFIWRCECKGGSCDFDTKREAENATSDWCFHKRKIRKVKE